MEAQISNTRLSKYYNNDAKEVITSTSESKPTLHNLSQLKSYPTVHRWLVNRNVFSITANLPIFPEDVLVLGGKQFLVVSNYRNEKGSDKTPRPAIRESVEDTNLQFINEGSTYYEFLTEQI